jgi:tRNA dimethylallyltransferase
MSAVLGKPSGPVVAIAGPTASGKSAAAVALAREFDGIVINADAMQVYRDLAVLTARPTQAEMAGIPHRLYGVLPAAERCNAGRWRGLALAEIAAAQSAGKLPILVGGTGLYLEALSKGLAPVPPIPDEIRAEARARHASLGADAFHAELSGLDPEMAARLKPGDTQRLLRAWEVWQTTGESLAAFQRRTGDEPTVALTTLLLMPPRETLYAAIDARCRRMLEQGALAEIRALLAQNLPEDLPAMKSVGVPELAAYIAGTTDLDTALSRFQQASRNYAKRQMTWFRHRLPGSPIWNEQYSESLSEEMFNFIRKAIDREKASV